MSSYRSCRRVGITVLGAIAMCAVASRPAEATLYTWNSANAIDSWHVAGNWSPSGGPQSTSDNATINNGKIAQITADATADYIRIWSGGVIQDSGNATPTLIFCGLGSGSGTYVFNDGTITTSFITVGQTTGLGSDFTMNGGAMTATRLWLGNNATGDATFHMNGGNMTVTGEFQVASHTGVENVKAMFTQTGGSVNVASTAFLDMGTTADTGGYAIYNLLGGTLKLDNATSPLLFSSDTAPIYFNFEYGSPTSAAMMLKGTWDFASLTAIDNADFRVHGFAATPGTLRFLAGTGDLAGYTVIYGVPEPSTLLLALVGLGCAVCVARRRRPSFSRLPACRSEASDAAAC
jgi:hypothetical protein